MKRICLLLVLCLLFSSCGTKEEPEFVKTIATYPPAVSADFTLPEGYAFADETTASIVRGSDDQVVGGILDMELDAACLEETDHDSSVNEYLRSLGFQCEYISMNADGYKAVSLAITDPETEVRTETSRCLFPKDGLCYDLWFDNAVITDEEKAMIRETILSE